MRIVRTVRGDIKPEELGVTASHEHIWCQKVSSKKKNFPLLYPGMELQEKDLIVKELKEYYKAGGRAIAEMTTDGYGRDVKELHNISKLTDIHVVSVSGCYVEAHIPSFAYEISIDELAEKFIQEITIGADGSSYKTGILKSAASQPLLEGIEEKGARAVARAQIETGVAITTHTSAEIRFEIKGGNIGTQHLNLFESEGVDLSKVIIGHTDENADIRQLIQLAKRGAFIQFDVIGKTHWLLDETRINLLHQLVDAGYDDKLLLSTDRCRLMEMVAYGGPGYAYILRQFVPKLQESGFDEKTINKFLVDNPAKVLSFEPKK